MQPKSLTLLALVSVLAATGAWSLGTRAAATARAEAPANAECRAELDPAVVRAGGETVVGVAFPAVAAGAGEVEAVRTEDGSGIVVLSFDPVEPGTRDLMTRLEIPKGAAGSWWLEFDAAGSTCTALLTVSESALGQ